MGCPAALRTRMRCSCASSFGRSAERTPESWASSSSTDSSAGLTMAGPHRQSTTVPILPRLAYNGASLKPLPPKDPHAHADQHSLR